MANALNPAAFLRCNWGSVLAMLRRCPVVKPNFKRCRAQDNNPIVSTQACKIPPVKALVSCKITIPHRQSTSTPYKCQCDIIWNICRPGVPFNSKTNGSPMVSWGGYATWQDMWKVTKEKLGGWDSEPTSAWIWSWGMHYFNVDS